MVNKVAILIDAGFFIRKFRESKNDFPAKKDVELLISDILSKVQSKNAHSKDVLFRTFYYDCKPFGRKVKGYKEGSEIDFSKSSLFINQSKFIDSLRGIEQFAFRLGELSFTGWKIDPYNPKGTPKPEFRQKGVDMKIGLDMAWMAGKKTVDKIVLVTGDSDFISPMKLVRREGILIFLYAMGHKIKPELEEHSDFII